MGKMISGLKFNTIVGCILIFLMGVSCGNEQIQESTYRHSAEIDKTIENGLSESSFTGAVVLVGSGNETLYQKSYGYATLYDQELKVVDNPDSTTVDHLFDIASLTKIFATTYAVMALHSDGLIQLDDPVADYIDEFTKPSHSEITIRHLLTHTSGLRQWYPTYYAIDNYMEFTDWVVDLDMIESPGENRRYSDLGFMVLGEIVERVTDQNIEDYLEERIYEPLGLSMIGFNPVPRNDKKIVSTSHGNPFEKRMISDENFGYRIDIDPEFLHAESLPKGSVGHTGFTGVNFVMSTKDDLYYIFLTNRQHVGVDESGNYPNLRNIREELSSIIFKDV